METGEEGWAAAGGETMLGHLLSRYVKGFLEIGLYALPSSKI